MSADDWRDADQADVTQAVHYALRFTLSGKPHGKRRLGDSKALAEHVVAHLLRANYRILSTKPRPPVDVLHTLLSIGLVEHEADSSGSVGA